MTILTGVICLLVVAIAAYVAVRAWQRRNGADPDDKSSGFRPHIGFTRLDGMESLSLLLDNRSREFVWAEEIDVFLTELSADQQTATPTCHGIQKIRQIVRGGDMLPISLAQVIYNAAGDPQRKYTCVLSSILHYRIGDEWFEKNMENFRIRMAGLKASRIDRERKPVQLPARPMKSQGVSAGSR
jgi:hypothetical protein